MSDVKGRKPAGKPGKKPVKKKKEPEYRELLVYVGPSVRGRGLQQYATFRNVPGVYRDEALKPLIVPVSMLAQKRKSLGDRHSAEAFLFYQILNKYKENK